MLRGGEKVMATIELYADRINQMSGFIKDIKKSVTDYNSELSVLKNKSLQINQSVCATDDIVSSIQASSQMQDGKIESLDKFYEKNEEFIADTARIDSDVADVVNQRKDDFYDKYDYLKPDCEKSGWEKFCDACEKATEWCKEHWEEIRLIMTAVAAVIVIVAATIATFGTPALLPILVGAAAGVGGQAIGDIASLILTGEWTGTWQDYFGAALGGMASGALLLTGNPALSNAAGSMISTLFTESVDNMTGKSNKSIDEILFDTAFSGVTGIIGGKIGEKLGKAGNKAINTLSSKSKLFNKFLQFSNNASKSVNSKIPFYNKLNGFYSYSANYKRAITRIKNGNMKSFSSKSVKNGVIGSLVKKYNLSDPGSFIKGRVTSYIKDEFKDEIKSQLINAIF